MATATLEKNIARRLPPIGGIRPDETLRQYFDRVKVQANGAMATALDDDAGHPPDHPPERWDRPLNDVAADYLDNAAATLDQQALYGKHYPPRPYNTYSPSVQSDMDHEMRQIGLFRQSRGDNAWHYDKRKPWQQPAMPVRLLYAWLAYRWNRSRVTRTVCRNVLRIHFARHERPVEYQLVDALTARSIHRIEDANYFATRNT